MNPWYPRHDHWLSSNVIHYSRSCDTSETKAYPGYFVLLFFFSVQCFSNIYKAEFRKRTTVRFTLLWNLTNISEHVSSFFFFWCELFKIKIVFDKSIRSYSFEYLFARLWHNTIEIITDRHICVRFYKGSDDRSPYKVYLDTRYWPRVIIFE